MLFFQCMAALLNPIYRRGEGIKWWLVSHTVAMFSFATVCTAVNLGIQSTSLIDHCEGPGPFYYQHGIRKTTLTFISNITFIFNGWLADGLLVSSSFDALPGCLILAPPLDLPLLRYLLYKPLDYFPSLSLVPCLLGYTLYLSASPPRCSGLMPLI